MSVCVLLERKWANLVVCLHLNRLQYAGTRQDKLPVFLIIANALFPAFEDYLILCEQILIVSVH